MIYKSAQIMRSHYSFHFDLIPALDISAFLYEGLHLFVKLLLFLFLEYLSQLTAISFIDFLIFHISANFGC